MTDPIKPRAKPVSFATMRRKTFDYPSLDKFLDVCERDLPVEWKANIGNVMHTATPINETWAEAMKLARHGWNEGAQSVRAVFDAAALGVPNEYIDFDMSGAYPDVGRFLAGDPENMCVRVEGETGFAGKHYTIYSSISCCGDAKAEHIANRGRAVLSLMRQLIELKASVTVYAFHAPEKYAFRWKLFDSGADNVFDLGRMAWAMMHPTNRRGIFAVYEKYARNTRVIAGEDYCVHGADPIDTEDCIVFPRLHYGHIRKHYSNDKDAERYVQAILHALAKGEPAPDADIDPELLEKARNAT